MMLCGRVWPVFRGPGGQARKGPRSATPRAIHTPDTTGTIHSQQNSQRKNGGETGEVGKSNIVNRFLRKDKKCSCCMHHGSDSHCGVRVCPPPADDDVMDGGGVSGIIWNRVLLLFYGASFRSFRSTPVSVLSLSAGGAGRCPKRVGSFGSSTVFLTRNGSRKVI